MLGARYRYQVYNGTGVSVTITVKQIQSKFASDGSLTLSSESTEYGPTSVGTVSYANGTSNGSVSVDTVETQSTESLTA